MTPERKAEIRDRVECNPNSILARNLGDYYFEDVHDLFAAIDAMEAAGNALIDYANKPETPWMPRHIYILLDDLLAAIEGRTARRELEEGK